MKVIYPVLTLLYIVFLVAGIALPGLNDVSIIKENDKILHFFVFFGLNLLIWKTLSVYSINFSGVVAFIFSNFMVFMLEWLQKVIPGRTYNLVDAFYGVVGVIGSVVLVFVGMFVISRFKQ